MFRHVRSIRRPSIGSKWIGQQPLFIDNTYNGRYMWLFLNKYQRSKHIYFPASTIPSNPHASSTFEQQQSVVQRLVDCSSLSGRNLAIASTNFSPMAMLPVSSILRSNGSQSNARKGNGQHNISRPEGIVCPKCCASVSRRLRSIAAERTVEENMCRIERSVCRFCWYHQ